MDNSWPHWQKLVLDRLDEHRVYHREHSERLRHIELEIARLKIKAGIWGGLAGMMPALTMIIWRLFS